MQDPGYRIQGPENALYPVALIPVSPYSGRNSSFRPITLLIQLFLS